MKIFITIEREGTDSFLEELFLGKVLREDGYLLYKRLSSSFDDCLKELSFRNPHNNLDRLESDIYSHYEIIFFDKNKFKNYGESDIKAIQYYLAVYRESLRLGIKKITTTKE